MHRVAVLAGGFSWNGKTYASLSQIALAITGTGWNGRRFFGLRDSAPQVRRSSLRRPCRAEQAGARTGR